MVELEMELEVSYNENYCLEGRAGDTIGAWQPDRTACCAWTGHGWGRQWWPAIRTSNGHLGAHLRCTLSSSCHRIVLATAPGVPTPQHRFPDPQKLAAGFQLAFSRTGPKTVSCSPLPVVRFGGEHNVLSLHTHHRSSQDCTCRPVVAIRILYPLYPMVTT